MGWDMIESVEILPKEYSSQVSKRFEEYRWTDAGNDNTYPGLWTRGKNDTKYEQLQHYHYLGSNHGFIYGT